MLAYAPLIERRLRAFRKPHCGSIRVDETYIKIRGQWRYLYRAIDKHGTSVDFLLTAKRDLDAAKRFFRKICRTNHCSPPTGYSTDGAAPTHPPSPQPRKTGCTSLTINDNRNWIRCHRHDAYQLAGRRPGAAADTGSNGPSVAVTAPAARQRL